MDILKIDELTKDFGGLRAIDSLDFSINENEILGLIGPNGAGKTTVFNLIMGRYVPNFGSIFYRGENIVGRETFEIVGMGIARVFQGAKPFNHATIYENIELCLFSNKIFKFEKSSELKEKILDITEKVGLKQYLNVLPGSLPFANLRRLEMAKVIALDPELFLLDEPFAGLSLMETEEMCSLVLGLKKNGKTIIIIDHNMKQLMKIAERFVVLSFGRKIAEGRPGEIVKNENVKRAYLGGD